MVLITFIWFFFIVFFYYFFTKKEHQAVDFQKIFNIFIGIATVYGLINIFSDLLLYSFPFIKSDSIEYCRPIFHFNDSNKFLFDSNRTILYPLFLFATWLISHNLFFAIILQALIFVSNAIIGYKISFLITRSKNFSKTVFIILLISWPLFKTFHYLMTGSIYIFLISIITYFLVQYATDQRARSLLGVSLFLGLSLLLRPSAKAFLFIPVLLLGFVLYDAFRQNLAFKRKMILNVLALILPVLVISIAGDLFHKWNMDGRRSIFEDRQMFFAAGFLIDFDSPLHKEAKECIREEIENFNKKYNADQFFGYYLKRPNYAYLAFGEPFEILKRNFPETYPQIAKEIAIEGILENPHIFISKVIIETARIFSHIYYPQEQAQSIQEKHEEETTKHVILSDYISNPMISPGSFSEEVLLFLKHFYHNINRIFINSYLYITIPYLLSIIVIMDKWNGTFRFCLIVVYFIPIASNLVHSAFAEGNSRHAVYALTPQIVLAFYAYQAALDEVIQRIENRKTRSR